MISVSTSYLGPAKARSVTPAQLAKDFSSLEDSLRFVSDKLQNIATQQQPSSGLQQAMAQQQASVSSLTEVMRTLQAAVGETMRRVNDLVEKMQEDREGLKAKLEAGMCSVWLNFVNQLNQFDVLDLI